MDFPTQQFRLSDCIAICANSLSVEKKLGEAIGPEEFVQCSSNVLLDNSVYQVADETLVDRLYPNPPSTVFSYCFVTILCQAYCVLNSGYWWPNTALASVL
ncbi:unnamed protein product [Ceratitis capitata]|uniref:(Mediterranean fruit fly) hypothetical protein n=1 Tax=Ceratitis capitata TaxID=7213 RepID=A0A811UGC0_CERCA|nr:unnamed protein product [Ceratitis capitata]